MAMCSSCSKFCGIELAELDDEPEFEVTVDGDQLTVTCSENIRLVQTSECCGDEVGEAELEVEDLDVTVAHTTDCPAHPDHKAPDDGTPTEDVDYTVEATFETDDWYQMTDRHGKPIKSSRYQKHFYGCNITVTVTCDGCKGTGEASTQVSESGSGFESLN